MNAASESLCFSALAVRSARSSDPSVRVLTVGRLACAGKER